jgi:putative thioredoxin
VLRSGRMLEARNIESIDPNAAAEIYRKILQESPQEARATIGLARVLVRLERCDEASELIAGLEKRGFLEPEAEQLKAAVDLQASGATDLDACRRAAEANPSDFAAQLKYAEALAGTQQYQQALDIALLLVELDRSGTGEAARQLMVNVFRVLPGESELVQQYRRKLAMLLF